MAAKDLYHEAVKKAVSKDGWTITHDPLTLEVGLLKVSIDLGAERLLAAERKGQQIAIEVKSFVSPSNLYEFHLAVGQYVNYRIALEENQSKRKLYLAVLVEIYDTFFQNTLV